MNRRLGGVRVLFLLGLLPLLGTNLAAEELTCPEGMQPLLVTGEPTADVNAGEGPGPGALETRYCYDPAQDCYLALSYDPSISPVLESRVIPFNSTFAGGEVRLETTASCGQGDPVPGPGPTPELRASANWGSGGSRYYSAVLTDSDGDGVFEALSINENGNLTGGRLLGNGTLEVDLGGGAPPLLLDIPYFPNAANPTHVGIGPAYFGPATLYIWFRVLPNGIIEVTNSVTGLPVARLGPLGASIGGGVVGVPTLSRLALLTLCFGLILAALWATRQRYAG